MVRTGTQWKVNRRVSGYAPLLMVSQYIGSTSALCFGVESVWSGASEWGEGKGAACSPPRAGRWGGARPTAHHTPCAARGPGGRSWHPTSTKQGSGGALDAALSAVGMPPADCSNR